MDGLDFVVLKNELSPCKETLLEYIRQDEIPSDNASCARFDTEYKEFLIGKYGQRGDEVSMAIIEAINNYAQHANGYDPAKMIDVRTFSIGNLLYVTVASDGKGFDPEILKKSRKEMQKRGGGGSIMKAFADGIMYAKNGKSAYFIFDTTKSKIN